MIRHLYAATYIGLLCIALIILTDSGCIRQEKSKEEVQRLEQIAKQLERFRQGEQFRGSVDVYVTNGHPDPKALELLKEALHTEPETVREQVVKILVAIGKQTDPLHPKGGNIIRNRTILAILIDSGLARPGTVRDYCLEALLRSVPSALLKEHGATLTENIKQWPDATGLLVLAKAKPQEAVPFINELMQSPDWIDTRETSIAGAALGDSKVEQKFITEFLGTTNPEQKAALARDLGFIGTQPALYALAGEMRTNLIIEMPMVSLRSVRVDIMAALSYVFPDKPFLYDNAVFDDSGYARVEAFCEEQFGVIWKTPRPRYLTIEGFPSEPPVE